MLNQIPSCFSYLSSVFAAPPSPSSSVVPILSEAIASFSQVPSHPHTPGRSGPSFPSSGLDCASSSQLPLNGDVYSAHPYCSTSN